MDEKYTYLPIVYKVTDPHNTPQDVQDIYKAWADEYDKDMNSVQQLYHGPEMLVSHVKTVVKNPDAKILEIGIGTGLFGLKLAKNGYVNLDGIDPSIAMVEKAKPLNVYKNIFINYVGKARLDIQENTYDAIVGSGVYVPGHVSWEAFEELQRITKPGGVIIIASSERYCNEEYLNYGLTLEEEIQRYEQNGAWKRESHSWQPYHGDHKASVSILRVN